MHIPIKRGKHKLFIPIFRPSGTTQDWISSLFFGGNIRYKNPKEILLKNDNKRLHKTISVGYVEIEINILKTGFPDFVKFV